MKLRAIIVAVSMTAIGASLMNCGSDDDNPTGVDGGTDTSSSTSSTSGFIPIDGSSTSSSSGSNNGFCTPKTCADLGANCGPQGDGCGDVIQCGTCTQGKETCGGGGTPSVCGGAAKCIPQTCTDLKLTCGPAGDGCGGALSCGTCQEPQICGGGGPGRCGGGILGLDGGLYYADGGACQPKKACAVGECGFVANGCGDVIPCGMCGAGEICGLNAPSVCAKPSCTKTTCTAQGANCGFVGDGCGGLLDCGGPNICASAGQICGGGGPNKCGTGGPDGGAGCVNFCVDQTKNDACGPGLRTKVTGTVYAPNGKLPLPDAIVFLPNGSKTAPYGLPNFVDGVASGVCEQCTLQSIGAPLVATKTKADGTFTLENVPPGVDFPIVIQLGRWRRVVTIPALTACSTTALTSEQTRLAKKQNEGSTRDTIPLLAVSTGSVDALECVLYKLGVDKTEFTNPSAAPGGAGGRIRLYQDSPNATQSAKGGARIDTSTPRTDSTLTNADANMNQYDAVIFGCAGAENDRDDAIDDRVRAYANRGGRVYATHFNYVYLYDRTPWDQTTPWNTSLPQSFLSVEGRINTSFPKGATFAQWLGTPLNAGTGVGVGALKGTTPPTVQLQEARGDARLFIAAGAQAWITQNVDPQAFGTPVFHYTFNTPFGAQPAQQCGKVLFSDFHVTIPTGGSTENQIFPAECGGATPPALTDQEKILAFFLFDLTSCITPDVPPPVPTCNKLTCADQGILCGKAGDGCGGQLDCPVCPGGQLCIGSPGKCVTPACSPSNCDSQGAECGVVSNGCGQSITCKPCDAGLTCGGSGPNKCGKNDCSPKTCTEQGLGCGPAGDGCGNPVECGPCPEGTTCGGGGVPNQCGAPNCTKRTCAQANGANCGPVADGCGGILQCGVCRSGEICGVDAPSRCGKGGPQ